MNRAPWWISDRWELHIDAALIGLALVTLGMAAGSVLTATVSPEPQVITRTQVTTLPAPPPRTLPPKTVTVTRTIERASRSSQRVTVPERTSGQRLTMPRELNARLWELIAACESSGRWHLNTGTFDGGLQFLPSTWRAHGGTTYAPTADKATKAQQIDIANRLSSGGDWLKPWPVCGKRAAARLGMRFP
jgi:hypothetical protein